jgi:hypothetical protein
MIKKLYGNYTLDQLKQFTDLVRESRNMAPELEKVMQETNSQKLNAILGNNFSWFNYYELPFNSHITAGALMLDWQDAMIHSSQSDDPQQYIFDFFNSLDNVNEWQGGYNGLFVLRDLVGLVVSIFKSIKSIMIYQKSLSTLIEEVRQGNEKALFDAVRIDRTMLACPSIIHFISMAELKGDNKFFLSLKSALKGPSAKHWIAHEELRFMMQALIEGGLIGITGDNIEQLFVDHLKMYPKTHGAQKNLLKQFLQTKKINHRK